MTDCETLSHKSAFIFTSFPLWSTPSTKSGRNTAFLHLVRFVRHVEKDDLSFKCCRKEKKARNERSANSRSRLIRITTNYLHFLLPAAPGRETFRRHLVIADIDHVTEPPRPLMPHVIPVSGLFIRKPQPIADPKHRAFLDSASNGAIVSGAGFV